MFVPLRCLTARVNGAGGRYKTRMHPGRWIRAGWQRGRRWRRLSSASVAVGRPVVIPLVTRTLGDRVVGVVVALSTVASVGHAAMMPLALDAGQAVAAVLGLAAMGMPALAFAWDKARSSWITFDPVGGVLRFERALPGGATVITAQLRVTAEDRLSTVAVEAVDNTGYRQVSYVLVLRRPNGDVHALAHGSACDTVRHALSAVTGGLGHDVIRDPAAVERLMAGVDRRALHAPG